MDDVTGDFRATVTAALDAAAERLTGHPYYHALRHGTLPDVVYDHFAGQDLHLLPAYGRAHAGAASTIPGAEAAGFLARMAAICLDNAAADAARGGGRPEAGPATVAYTSFLAAAAAASPAAALGALLPSAYLQLAVNDDLVTRVVPGTGYEQRVRESHPGDEYRKLVDEFVGLVAGFGAGRCAAEQAELMRHLTVAARFEYAFVQAAWLLESWA
ncbi:hypothetical protein [Actinoplanes siamensis]|uniref:Thiaminase-2/PQQC domain-containing protein n=1 Tax=Actinoplanes siamensis TaxID=1223317 RepID=A0A919TMI9_9ACTN|nr:hypothetical protein [Actinoplanes siamensis]GIF07105.1 hypothetical protein Asi03nite_46430 [Actinoplanes siamensis]